MTGGGASGPPARSQGFYRHTGNARVLAWGVIGGRRVRQRRRHVRWARRQRGQRENWIVMDRRTQRSNGDAHAPAHRPACARREGGREGEHGRRNCSCRNLAATAAATLVWRSPKQRPRESFPLGCRRMSFSRNDECSSSVGPGPSGSRSSARALFCVSSSSLFLSLCGPSATVAGYRRIRGRAVEVRVLHPHSFLALALRTCHFQLRGRSLRACVPLPRRYIL
jgi:hypothetical protein